MVAHHVAAFFSVLTTVVFHETHMYTLMLLATECTTPFINFRWLLEKMVRPGSALRCWLQTVTPVGWEQPFLHGPFSKDY